MYIPSHFRIENREEIISFIKAHPLAVFCSNGEKIPFVSHLPFTMEEQNEKLILISHFAAGNPQSKKVKENDEVLVIFNGQDAYISPSLYEKKENVPTWNYMAVHASGKFHFNHSDEGKEKVLLAMIETFEPAYKKQWDELSKDYISRMLKGIVAFEIEVEKLEGKFKLSQNKTLNEQEKIATSLGENELASTMKKNIEKKS
jgi:transcriptional regulator